MGIDLLEGIATTRAIRRFRPEPIPEHDLATMLFAASRAPSGSNRQNFRFVLLRDGDAEQEAKKLLGAAARRAWSGKRRADGYDTGTGSNPNSPKARTARAMQEFVEGFERIPLVVLPCLIRHRPPTPTEGASVYPAVQNLLLAARALGYGGVISMWHAFVEPDLRRLLAIPEDIGIMATVAMGRPVGGHGPVRRRPLREVVYDGAWGREAAWAVDPPGTRFTSAGPPSP